MKTKTLGLMAALASLLVTGCGKDGDSSSTNSVTSNGGNPVVDKYCPEGYTVVNNSKEVEARGVPSNIQDITGVKAYKSAFSSDPNTFDYLANNKQTNSK